MKFLVDWKNNSLFLERSVCLSLNVYAHIFAYVPWCNCGRGLCYNLFETGLFGTRPCAIQASWPASSWVHAFVCLPYLLRDTKITEVLTTTVTFITFWGSKLRFLHLTAHTLNNSAVQEFLEHDFWMLKYMGFKNLMFKNLMLTRYGPYNISESLKNKSVWLLVLDVYMENIWVDILKLHYFSFKLQSLWRKWKTNRNTLQWLWDNQWSFSIYF